MLRKGVKSLQLMVNEAMSFFEAAPVSASAFSQARYHLRHTAFIELNRETIVDTLYCDDDFRTFRGHRLLAIDGSKLLLPDTADIRQTFGTIPYGNGESADIGGERPYALASVLYDVLNRVALDATLARSDAYEVDLAIGHLPHTGPADILVMDRNYPSYRMMATLTQAERHFVIRCSKASFAPVRKMLAGHGPASQIVTLPPCAGKRAEIRAAGLPERLAVRLVRVRLSTGAWEVLATSLHDEKHYPTADFLTLYGQRWGIETFYGVLKTRLGLENFSGTRAEAVLQDFHATIYLSGLESILTADAQTDLSAKQTRHPQQVNRMVSFNAIKAEALELLLGDTPTAELCETLTALFMSNPTPIRRDRNPPRRKISARREADYLRRRKKHCF
jgi:hypothetical protein